MDMEVKLRFDQRGQFARRHRPVLVDADIDKRHHRRIEFMGALRAALAGQQSRDAAVGVSRFGLIKGGTRQAKARCGVGFGSAFDPGR
jgi:hypothetical protein